jgi:hypothetical protein
MFAVKVSVELNCGGRGGSLGNVFILEYEENKLSNAQVKQAV